MKIKDVNSFFYYLLAYWSWKQKPTSVLPEILYVLDIEDVIKLFKVFGGQTLKVPTLQDLSNEMLEAVAAHMHRDEKCSHEYIRNHLEIGKPEYRKMMENIEQWESFLGSLNTDE